LPETYYHKALTCLRLGNTEGAMEELNKTIWYSREQHAEAFYYKGILLYETEEFDKALYAFEKATQLGHEQANYEMIRLRNGVVNTKKSKK
jgi:tetratricopeptide (TPR) repeat protein